MKSVIKSFGVYSLLLAMLVGVCPCLAQGEAPEYLQVNYGNQYTFNTEHSIAITANSSAITLPEYNNYKGRAVGGTFTAKAGKAYTLDFEANQGEVDVAYFDAGLFVFAPTVTGNFDTDLVANRMIQVDYKSQERREIVFTAEQDGEYKVLITANLRDQLWKERFSPDVTCTLRIREHDPYVYTESSAQEAKTVQNQEELIAALQQIESQTPEKAAISLGGNIDLTGVFYRSVNLEKTALELLGNGYKITGITAPFMSTVKQLVVANLTLDLAMNYQGTGTQEATCIGGLAGEILAYGSVKNCHVGGFISFEKYKLVESVGGFWGCYVGERYDGFIIANSTCTVEITVKNSDTVKNLGYFFGYDYWGINARVVDCVGKGTILVDSCQTARNIGGIVGEAYIDLRCERVDVLGAITVTNTPVSEYIGGMVGYAANDFSPTVCSANLTITAPSAVHVGGLLGCGKNNVEIATCSFTGSLAAKSLVGGIAGALQAEDQENGATLTKCTVSGSVKGEQLGAGICPAVTFATLDECVAKGTVQGFTTAAQLVIADEIGQVTLTKCTAHKNSSIPTVLGVESNGILLDDFSGYPAVPLAVNKTATLSPKRDMVYEDFGEKGKGFLFEYLLSLKQGEKYLAHHLWTLTKGFAFEVSLGVYAPDGEEVGWIHGNHSQSVTAMDGQNGDPYWLDFPFTARVSGEYKVKILVLANQLEWHATDLENAYFGQEATSYFQMMRFPDSPAVVKIASPKDLLNLNETVNRLANPLWVKVEVQGDVDMKGLDFAPLNLPVTKDKILYQLEVEGNGYTLSKLSNPFSCYATQVKMNNLTVDLAVDDCPYSFFPTYQHATTVGGLITRCEDGVFENCKVSGYMIEPDCFRFEDSGGIVGSAIGSLTVKNCQVNLQVTANVNSVTTIGGVVGWCKTGVVENTHVNFGFTVPAAYHGVSHVGGLVGYNGLEALTIENCSVKATINTYALGGTSLLGGVAGSLTNAKVNRTYATVSLTAKDESYSNYIGGFAGRLEEDCTVKNCFVKGKVQGKTDVAGFAAIVERGTSLFNCYTTADLIGETRLSGFVGRLEKKGTLSNCYAAGSFSVIPNTDMVNVLLSVFGGEVKTVWTDPSVAFVNCYATQKGVPTHLDKDGVMQQVLRVDLSNHTAVEVMETALNRFATQKGFLPYITRNEKNAPAFTHLLGDVNGDFLVNAKDALVILKFSVNKVELSSLQREVAQLDSDTAINAKDALEVLKYSVGKIVVFPIQLV